jgi:hypothetical protein
MTTRTRIIAILIATVAAAYAQGQIVQNMTPERIRARH